MACILNVVTPNLGIVFECVYCVHAYVLPFDKPTYLSTCTYMHTMHFIFANTQEIDPLYIIMTCRLYSFCYMYIGR